MTNGYFKLRAFNAEDPIGDLFFFDSQSFNSILSAWEQCSALAARIDSGRAAKGRPERCAVSHWGHPPMRGPWAWTLHIGKPSFTSTEDEAA